MVHHTQMTYEQEEDYYYSKRSLYIDAFWTCASIAEKVKESGAHTLDAKEKIAQEVVAQAQQESVMQDVYHLDYDESICDHGKLAQRVHLTIHHKDAADFSVHVGVVWKEDLTVASTFFSDHADCDIVIAWEDVESQSKVRLVSVEKPRFEEEHYRQKDIWSMVNPLKEQHCLWSIQINISCSFADYRMQFNILGERTIPLPLLPDLPMPIDITN